MNQYNRIVSAIEYTISELKRGPKDRQDGESTSVYEQRCEVWYDHKYRFSLFACRCLRDMDKTRAEGYLADLRQIRELI